MHVLGIQNASVAMCALMLSLFLYHRDKNGFANQNLEKSLALITSMSVIGFSSIGRLASAGTVIILQRDWIVVIADGNTDMLASKFSLK